MIIEVDGRKYEVTIRYMGLGKWFASVLEKHGEMGPRVNRLARYFDTEEQARRAVEKRLGTKLLEVGAS